MNDSAAYRLGRMYGRLSRPARGVVIASIVIGMIWMLTPSGSRPPERPKTQATARETLKAYDPVVKWGKEMVASAKSVMAAASVDATIYEEGSHLVVEMKMYITDPNVRHQYVRSIADSDVVLHGDTRNIYFYNPSGKRIAQADRLNGVRLLD